ncbi:hypothetical protein FQA39_LY08635 [Lamprigera yunnana]|nr:hypothetical protein FQA39_LY08635 [Lamprigera yunnana]
MPDLMYYYWVHLETATLVPQIPGRLHSLYWLPTSPCPLEFYDSALLTSIDISDLKISSPILQEICSAKYVEFLEEINSLKQEVAKYKTMNEIQTLIGYTDKDFGSPNDTKNVENLQWDVCKKKTLSNENVKASIQKNAQSHQTHITTQSAKNINTKNFRDNLKTETLVPELLDTPVKKCGTNTD